MGDITNIKITNIKGFGTKDNDFDINLCAKKINIVVAPNGFGKTSITTAFKCVGINSARLIVPKDSKYMRNDALDSALQITDDSGATYVADKTRNEIASHFNCYIINSLVKADTKTVKIGGYTQKNGILAIDEVNLGRVIPKPQNQYSVSELRKEFGVNGGVLCNMSEYFDNFEFLNSILELETFERYKSKKRSEIVKAIVENVQNAKGPIKTICNNVDLSQISQDKLYSDYVSKIEKFKPNISDWEVFSTFWQLLYLFEHERDYIRKQRDYLEYAQMRRKLDNNFQDFNSSWKTDLKSVEEKGVLKVKFPRVDELSNGQRDVLAFIVQLQNVKNKLRSNKQNIVIIDEIFDYMDDANLIAAQYYLTKYLDINTCNSFIIILSHLDPVFFKNYIFSTKKTNICYLSKRALNFSEEMKAFLRYRNSLDGNKNPQNDLSIVR